MQTPLPEQIDEARVMLAIDPMKDVDGLHPFSAGQLYLGRQTLVPATPLGVMHLLNEYKIPIAGPARWSSGAARSSASRWRCCSCRRTPPSRSVTPAPKISRGTRWTPISSWPPSAFRDVITADMVKQGATVIDVGITRTEAGLVGDVAEDVAEVAAFLTPVPGGVGPMTIAALLGNAVRAARYRRGQLAFPRI